MDNNINNNKVHGFLKCWKNLVIRKNIIKYLVYYNLHYHTRTFTLKEYQAYPFKQYLRSIEIEFDNTDREQLLQWLSELPANVNQVIFRNMEYYRNPTFMKFDGQDFNTFGRPLLSIDIPPWIEHITFDPLFDQPFVEPLPSTLKSVEFGKYFRQPLECVANATTTETSGNNEKKENQYIGKSIFPENLEELKFFYKSLYNLPLEKHHLPKKCLKKLCMGFSFNQPINEVGILPSTLEELQLTYQFNQTLLPGIVPDSVTYLRFGNNYNQAFQVGSIPSKIKTLILGTDYNQPFKSGVLPHGLQELIFANTSQFNQEINNEIIPSTVTRLHLGCGFYQPLQSNSIPSSITELSLGGSPNTVFGDYWSANANTPTLLGGTTMYNKYIVTPNCLPKSIGSLQLNPSFFIKKGSIPNSVYELQGCNFKFVQFIPSSVKKLKLNNDFNRPFKIGELPSQLLTLDLGNDFDQPITTKTFQSNSSLNKLKLSTHFKSTIQPYSLPPLTKLYLGFSYNNPQPFTLPSSLTYLDLGNEMNQPLHHYHLDQIQSLKYLKLGKKFNQFIQPCSLPPHLVLLELGGDFTQPIDTCWLPPNLKALIIQGSCTTIDEFPLSPLLEFIIVPFQNTKFLNSLYDLNLILNQKRKIKKHQQQQQQQQQNQDNLDYSENSNYNNNSDEIDIYENELFNIVKVTNYNITKIFSKYYKIFKENNNKILN